MTCRYCSDEVTVTMRTALAVLVAALDPPPTATDTASTPGAQGINVLDTLQPDACLQCTRRALGVVLDWTSHVLVRLSPDDSARGVISDLLRRFAAVIAAEPELKG